MSAGPREQTTERGELQKRIDKVLSEQFPDAPRLQREYATTALIEALELRYELEKRPVDTKRIPCYCGHGFQAELLLSRRWVTAWSAVGEA